LRGLAGNGRKMGQMMKFNRKVKEVTYYAIFLFLHIQIFPLQKNFTNVRFPCKIEQILAFRPDAVKEDSYEESLQITGDCRHRGR
jgi:hypothetical protein